MHFGLAQEACFDPLLGWALCVERAIGDSMIVICYWNYMDYLLLDLLAASPRPI